MSDERLKEPPANYWPQKFSAVWDVDGVTCDAEIDVRPDAEVEQLREGLWNIARSRVENPNEYAYRVLHPAKAAVR